MKPTNKYNRKWLRLASIAYPLISIVCFIFPFIPRYFINRALSRLHGYTGRIGHIRLTPFAIRIVVHDCYLDMIDRSTGSRSVFFSARSIQVDIDWWALWSGTLRAEVQLVSPTFTLVPEHFGGAFVNPLFEINPGMDILVPKIEVRDGKLEFADDSTDPQVLMQIEYIEVDVAHLNIKAVPDADFLTDVMVRADVYQGRFYADMKVNLFSRTPDFTLSAGISDVNMVLLNDFFKAYGHFDIHSGIMGMHTEVEARGGSFQGYVESVIQDLKIMGPEDSRDSIGRYLWKSLIGLAAGLLEDHTNDELAARIQFQSTFQHPEVHIGRAILEVLASAFVHGLTPYMKNEVKIDL